MLEWNGSYGTLNKYDNEADSPDCHGGGGGVQGMVGGLELNNGATEDKWRDWKEEWL